MLIRVHALSAVDAEWIVGETQERRSVQDWLA